MFVSTQAETEQWKSFKTILSRILSENDVNNHLVYIYIPNTNSQEFKNVLFSLSILSALIES
jgi:hypothetical protein